MSVCFICLKVATDRCLKCNVWFCSKNHREMHGNCFPFTVTTRPIVGRCLEASRDIQAGEVVFEEFALAVGPNPVSTPQCINCHVKVDVCSSSTTWCTGCSYPLCRSCQLSDRPFSTHNGAECSILCELAKNQKMCIRDNKQLNNTVYEPVLPIRILRLKNTCPEKFAIVDTLMDHNEDRRGDVSYWQHSCSTVIEPIVKAFGCNKKEPEQLSFDQVSRAVGIVEVNNYEIYNVDGLTGFRGVYPLTSLMSHSCMPNCRMLMERSSNCANKCMASVDIAKGEELSIAYVNLLMPTYLRRQRLKDNWYFDCVCKRCQDPTELSSYIGALKCEKCHNISNHRNPIEVQRAAYLLPVEPLNYDSMWSCPVCKDVMDSEAVKCHVEALLQEKNALHRPDLNAHLIFLHSGLKKLHQNHYVLGLTRRWLLPLYCRRTVANGGQEISLDMWSRKLELCHHHLEVLDKIQPGLTKDRGKTLFELCDAWLQLQNNKFQNGCLSAEALGRQLTQKCIPRLNLSIRCLEMEPEATFEHHICMAATNMLNQVVNFTEMLLKS